MILPLDLIEQHLVKNILSPGGQAQYHTGDVSTRELAPFVDEVRAISACYLEHSVGTDLPSPVRNARAAQAYALYYTPINAAKIIHLLPQLSFGAEEISILDVGCGPGTVGLALLSALNHSLKLTCVESCTEMRKAAEKLLHAWQPGSKLRALSLVTSLAAIEPRASFDLVVAANILAELSEQNAQRCLAALANAVAPGGFLLLIEPGQLTHTRRLMQLRDHLVREQPQLTPVFPCLRKDLCPMLESSQSDWCHGELEWYQPRLHAQLDRLLSFNKHRIKFSSFIFQHGGMLRPGMRVLTPPRKTPRGVECLMCGQGTYGIVRIAKRNRSPETRAFEKASVFDRLIFSESCLGEAPAELVISLAPELR